MIALVEKVEEEGEVVAIATGIVGAEIGTVGMYAEFVFVGTEEPGIIDDAAMDGCGGEGVLLCMRLKESAIDNELVELVPLALVLVGASDVVTGLEIRAEEIEGVGLDVFFVWESYA